ncbi:MAG: NUDIX hydrolase [Chloroflexi bacterium]|nr:NUDIX hydrolase [Chloroflexota bacterium]MCI0575304.1 NUDIX hydrolase [Chloroflexota bacterium]MCI0647626.1 NUDIX hydrolase [Chloroflexota bacterium]MCI0731263.1 NUDIX hydrolase [Chloroflexota bacterium]
MKPGVIRALAICVFRRDGRILVFEGHDTVKGKVFYRPLGGSVEFGEYSRETIIREMQEELNAEISELRYLGSLENIFTYQGETGHEIIQVYDASFVDSSFYERPLLQGIEDDAQPFKAVWKSLDFFQATAAPPLYPDGLLSLLLGLG